VTLTAADHELGRSAPLDAAHGTAERPAASQRHRVPQYHLITKETDMHTSMIPRRPTLMAAAAVLAMTLSLVLSAMGSADATPGSSSETRVGPQQAHAVQSQTLARVRAATARYHDVDAAVADGYVPVSPCVEAPGLGAMGVHYLNHELLVDGVLDPVRPELLLYLPDGEGRERLVGVEYLQVDDDQDLATDQDRPSLFGVPFDGPMEGHGPGEPVHYDLHVWLWSHNPAGMFAMWNPALSCGKAIDAPAPRAGH
jgi:hypothetical protein